MRSSGRILIVEDDAAVVMTLRRILTEEGVTFKANMSESSLVNIDKAMSGAALSGQTISIGSAKTAKQMSVQFVGTNPAGFARTITIYLCTATGNVKGTFKKEGELFIPITLEALKPATGNLFDIVDATS